MLRHFPWMVCLLLVAGCATTPYQRFAGGHGYSETPLRQGVYEVSYVGEKHYTATQAKYYATVRAAEVTVEHQERYFIILETREDVRHEERVIPGKTTIKTESNAKPKNSSEESTITRVIEERPSHVVSVDQPTCILTIGFAPSPSHQTLDAYAILSTARRDGMKLNDDVLFVIDGAR